MASTAKKIERTPDEVAELVARRNAAQANKRSGPSEDAVPMWQVMQLRQLGHELRKERERLGLTQAALSIQIGMDEPAISRIEKGLNLNPTLDTLNRIASGLGRKIELGLSDECTPEVAKS